MLPVVRVLGLEVRVADLFLRPLQVGSTLYADRRPPFGLWPGFYYKVKISQAIARLQLVLFPLVR
jgi:hypothetical protein